jgi:hypothetical protein
MVDGVRQLPFPLQTCPGVTTPFVHDCGVPQAVPEGALPLATQTGLPVVQSSVPVGLHGSPVEQVAPELQTTQLPPLHTRLAPQVVPSGAVPVAWQVAVPDWQVVIPSWHGSLGVQLTPAVQLLHVPPLQTLLFPQVVPFAMLPVSAQTEVPVAQDVAPVRHAVVGVQVTPAVHDTQLPV